MGFKKENCSINILGTNYKLIYKNYNDDQEFKDGAAGYCSMLLKEIVICNVETFPDYKLETDEQRNVYYKELLRHEILHAFLYESGLDNETSHDRSWAVDEEIIDWFAIQSPKIFNAYLELGLI